MINSLSAARKTKIYNADAQEKLKTDISDFIDEMRATGASTANS
jgi:hypothetical protein